MRFCLDARTATNHFPGIGRYVSNLARAVVPLLSPGEEIVILHNPSEPSIWVLPPAVEDRVTFIPTGISPFNPSQLWNIPPLLSRQRCRLYHSPYYLMPYKPGIPTVLTVYDLIPLIFPDYVSTQARMLFFWTTKLALWAAESIIAISHNTKQDYLKQFNISPEKVNVIPLAVSSDFRPQPVGDISRVREIYDLPSKFILYFGINKPHKNLLRLIDAWSLLMKEAAGECYLFIAGEWDERYTMPKRKVAQLGLEGQIKFLGPIPEEDLPGLYAAAIGFVFPSLYEGFGLPVLEAMACGTPVACSNISSLAEIVGDAALLFDPHSIESIAASLDQLIAERSLRNHLVDLGFHRTKRFTWERTARDTLRVYRQLSGD